MSGKVKADVKRKPTRNARQYADRIARTATERADSTEPPRTLTPTAKKESAPHQPTEILSLVEQYKEAQQLIEAAQAEMDDLKRQITEEMTRRDVDTMDAGTHKVRYQTVTSSRLDSKGLKAAAPELAARFTKTTTSRRFSIA